MALITTRKWWKLMEGDKMDGLGYISNFVLATVGRDFCGLRGEI